MKTKRSAEEAVDIFRKTISQGLNDRYIKIDEFEDILKAFEAIMRERPFILEE